MVTEEYAVHFNRTSGQPDAPTDHYLTSPLEVSRAFKQFRGLA